jgi:hypothetical protein
METPADADAPRPEPTDEAPELPLTEAGAEAEEMPLDVVPEAGDELADLVAAAEQGRLKVAQEERTTELLKEALMGGRAGVARVVAVLPRLPWLVGVRAVETVWPELTAGFRTQLLSGLAKDETDAARRMRLSMARALYKIDPPVGLKIAVGVAKEMRDKDTGAVTAKDAQMFSNVFIGRARPWVALLPLEELKPAEADLLVNVTVLTAFSMPHPPLTQLSILKWVQANGRLDKLEEPAQAAVLAGLARWNPKWQKALRKEVAEVPEAMLAVLRPETPEAVDAPESAAAESDETASGDEAVAGEEGAESAPRRERPVYVSREEEARRKAILDGGGTIELEVPAAPASEDEADEDEDEEREESEPRPERGPRDYREPREPRAMSGRGSFNVTQALRQIESHVNGLRSELEATKSKLRHREKDAQRAPRKPDVPVIEGEPTPEELARLNHQLGLRNAELQTRIDELTQHAEDLAAASGAHTDQPVADPDAQLRALLALKLQEDYADFRALEKEGNDIVVQQHYRTLIAHLFEVLLAQGVPLQAEPS